MRKYIKLIIGVLIGLPGIFMASSCEDFLDKKPLTATLDDLNQGGVTGQIFGLYSLVKDTWGFSSLSWIALHSMRGDEAEKGSDQTDGADYTAPYDNYQYIKNHFSINSYWSDHYDLINRANTAIQTADSLKLNDAAGIINVAEARFFRAFSYFDLVRTFGEVPKIDFRIYSAAQAIQPKVSVDEIYKLIDEDLTFAGANLPATWGSQYVGRLTSGAAKTLHAKAHLFRKNWPQALALSQEVVNSGVYSLFPNYYGIFKESGENCSESIYETQCYVSVDGVVNKGSQWGTCQGVRQSDASGWNLGWGWNTPTETLAKAYEPGDTRKDGTLLIAGQSDDPSTGGYGKILPRSVFDNPPGILFRKYYNKKVYSDPARHAATNILHEAPWVNKRILRYADVILMVAESANETGNGPLAATMLEQIRKRARGGATGVLPEVKFVSQAQMRTALKHERMVEFGMDGERFFDLVRWGDALSVLGPLGYQPRSRYHPIPQPEIDKAKGVLIQNPDY